MMDTAPTPIRAELISADHIARLNEARTILEWIKEASRQAAWAVERAPRTDYMAADAYDYGQVTALASSSADGIFDLLNTINAHGVQRLTAAQLHNQRADDE